MSGFFTSLFGGGSKRKRTTPLPGPRTDARKRTPNAEETGRKAVPRPTDPSTTPPSVTPPPIPTLVPDPITAAHLAAFRQRRKGRSQRASSLLGGSRPAAGTNLQRKTLIGY